MKRLLDDYIFDDTLRYEGHKLIFRDADGMEIVLGGMMGAAVLSALLDNTDEGDARGIAIDSEAQRVEFFNRYEREVRRDSGGLFTTEVEALSAAYIELAGTDALLRICRNDRLFDLGNYAHRFIMREDTLIIIGFNNDMIIGDFSDSVVIETEHLQLIT